MADDYDGPTPERLGKGDIERATRKWFDDHKTESNQNPGLPYLVVGVLTRMHRKRDITDTMKTAGERFAADFAISGFDPRHAPDLARIPGQAWREDGTVNIEAARRRVNDALDALGGRASVGASACWHVLGCEDKITKWSAQTGINHRYFPGILIASLSQLERHFGLVA